ncbi:MAG: peptide/nickel transport system permease protein [Gaiellaceae bacterium]|jgi:peptide/nickel transport system permease protein|nr:peptide/nickel transport system permease protein [Gaiellaceae bacterium]
MLGYALRRAGIAIVLLWILSAITFVIYLKVPADPAGFIVDVQHASPAQIAKAHHILGTDKPAVVQYEKYMVRLLHGDFGLSWPTVVFSNGRIQGAAVGQLVWKASLVTGSLVLGGFVLLLLVAVPLGTFAATRPRSLIDRFSLGLSVAAISTHPLVVGLLLQLFVGNKWKLLPASGYCTVRLPTTAEIAAWKRFAPAGVPEPCGGAGQWAWHLLLPWLTFALFFVALYMRIVRARMLEVLEEPWVRTARAKGASEFRVIRSHALRNAIAPVVTMTAMDAGMAIGIAMYIETVFGLPGLGRTMIRALAGFQGYDLPVILAVTLVAASAIIVLNLVADLVLIAIDPTAARRGRGARLLRQA